MEITSATTSKAAYVKGLTEEDEEELEQQEVQEEETAVQDKQETDQVAFSTSDLDEETVEEKAEGYIQNILIAANLTDQSQAELQRYLQNFDVATFIKKYGPFESVRDISAAMYAVTAGMVKYQQDEE